jgi:hypothetical protein
MTPKETAIELYNSFYNEIPLPDGCSFCSCKSDCAKKKNAAKGCAELAALRLSGCTPVSSRILTEFTEMDKQYWQEVLTEVVFL